MLAIVRIGAIYVPLDPAHPHAHRARLAQSIGARTVILPDAESDDDYGNGIQVLNANTLDARAAALAQGFTAPEGKSATAYVMFTSGSTGQPKGVAVPRSEEHTSELQSLMRISSAVFCLK